MNQRKGTTIVPFSFFSMATDLHINKITSLLEELLLEEPAYFCVNIRIKPTNNIKVFLDGDDGLPIAKCVQFNRCGN